MKMFSFLTAAALFSSIAVANAAETIVLTDNQLDSVTAGQGANVTVRGTATAIGLGVSEISITGSARTSFTRTDSTSKGTLEIRVSSS
jgi:hypothetical protein